MTYNNEEYIHIILILITSCDSFKGTMLNTLVWQSMHVNKRKREKEGGRGRDKTVLRGRGHISKPRHCFSNKGPAGHMWLVESMGITSMHVVISRSVQNAWTLTLFVIELYYKNGGVSVCTADRKWALIRQAGIEWVKDAIVQEICGKGG